MSGVQAAFWQAKLNKQALAMEAKQFALEAARKERIAANKSRLKAQAKKIKVEEARARLDGQQRVALLKADLQKFNHQKRVPDLLYRLQHLPFNITGLRANYVAFNSRDFSDHGFVTASYAAAEKYGQDYKPREWLLIAVETVSLEIISRMRCQHEVFAETDPAYGLIHDIIWASSSDIHTHMMSPDI